MDREGLARAAIQPATPSKVDDVGLELNMIWTVTEPTIGDGVQASFHPERGKAKAGKLTAEQAQVIVNGLFVDGDDLPRQRWEANGYVPSDARWWDGLRFEGSVTAKGVVVAEVLGW